MAGKTDLWDRLSKTNPEHTKKFQRAGGFKGTAINPIYSIHRMTEEFGPCGEGWGMNEPKFQVVETNDETLVYCTVGMWHGNRDKLVFGVGGDKAMGKNKNGVFTDDEAFKKSYTDALTNAFKMVGVSADVYMGLFDDNKYVSELTAEFEEKRQNPHVTRADDIMEDTVEYDERGNPINNIPLPDEPSKKMLVKDARLIFPELEAEMEDCRSLVQLERWGKSAAKTIDALPEEWKKVMRRKYGEKQTQLREEVAA